LYTSNCSNVIKDNECTCVLPIVEPHFDCFVVNIFCLA